MIIKLLTSPSKIRNEKHRKYFTEHYIQDDHEGKDD